MLMALLLIVVAVTYRLILAFTGDAHDVGSWNFAPLAAIALCGGIYLPRRMAAGVTLGSLLASDILLNFHYRVAIFDTQMMARYFALGMTVLVGFWIRRSPNWQKVLAGTVASSLFFYLLTNTGSWLASEAYSKTFLGWFQAMTVGLPGFPPTLLFFRNSLLSDLIFTAVFMGCYSWNRASTARKTLPFSSRAIGESVS